jgi:hypothetical protein
MGTPVFYTSDTNRQRKYHVMICARCGAHIWTSSTRADYTCISCRRALGLAANHRVGSYTTLASAPRQALALGTCRKCRRPHQPLANGVCECCRFYDIADVDPQMSANGHRGRGGRKAY